MKISEKKLRRIIREEIARHSQNAKPNLKELFGWFGKKKKKAVEPEPEPEEEAPKKKETKYPWGDTPEELHRKAQRGEVSWDMYRYWLDAYDLEDSARGYGDRQRAHKREEERKDAEARRRGELEFDRWSKEDEKRQRRQARGAGRSNY